MPASPRAKPEFWLLSEEDVRLALRNENPTNPVGCEVMRIAKAYAEGLRAHIFEHRSVPESLLYEPKCPIEVVALEMLANAEAWKPRARKAGMH